MRQGQRVPTRALVRELVVTRHPIVLQSEDLSSDALQWLERHCRVVSAPYHSRMFAQTIPNAAGLVVRTFTQVDRALLERAGALRVVGRAAQV